MLQCLVNVIKIFGLKIMSSQKRKKGGLLDFLVHLIFYIYLTNLWKSKVVFTNSLLEGLILNPPLKSSSKLSRAKVFSIFISTNVC